MKFIVVHSHYRPGGVRRVIELALPNVLSALRPIADTVVLAGGEKPPEAWLAGLRQALPNVNLTCSIESALGYISESRVDAATLRRRVRAHLEQLLAGTSSTDGVVWAHNLGLGRNHILASELARACTRRGIPLIAHHHDWWFDNRWHCWPDLRRTGIRSIDAAAAALLTTAPIARHAAINHADGRILAPHFPGRTGWLPNPPPPSSHADPVEIRRASDWLSEQIGHEAPVWLVPCRLLRRKNLAEALLLTRWLRPEAFLVTTAGPSSADETHYAAALAAAARQHRWPLRLGVLADDSPAKPSIPALLAASEAILLTSLQEGFGLPKLEAVAARRPLIARRLPNIEPDLTHLGFRFPHVYDEVHVDPRLFDWRAEQQRQDARWSRWRRALPPPVRALAHEPPPLIGATTPQPIAFSRLTLIAQLEVLAQDPAESWRLCSPLNPLLGGWRKRAARGSLSLAAWPRAAAKALSGPAYGRRFAQLLRRSPGTPLAADAAAAATRAFLREKLAGQNQYPLLWSPEP